MKTGFRSAIITVFLISMPGMIAAEVQVDQHAKKAKGSEENKKITGKKPFVKVKHTTLYKNSHILVHRGQHTIIPKKSILVLPELLKQRVAAKPDGKFVLWPEFKQANRDWIWTYEVSLDQAKGANPISENKIKDLSKLNRVVVALYHGNPVSVLPAKNKIAKK